MIRRALTVSVRNKAQPSDLAVPGCGQATSPEVDGSGCGSDESGNNAMGNSVTSVSSSAAGDGSQFVGAWAIDGSFMVDMGMSRPASHPHSMIGSDAPQVAMEGLNQEASSELLSRQEEGPGERASSLAVAQPVSDEESPEEMPQAQEWEPNTQEEAKAKTVQRKQKCWVRSIAAFLAYAAALALTIFVIVQLSMDKAPKERAETDDMMAAMASTEERILSLLPSDTQRSIARSDSPQSKAFQWIIEDPKVSSYPDWRVVQRYALVTLFYAAGGDSTREWINSQNWLSYDHHECDWFATEAKKVGTIYDPAWRGMYHEIYDLTGETPCDQETGMYRHVWLVANDLEGTIPNELFLVSSLMGFSFRNNNLHGTLPSLVGQLTNLGAIDLSNNEMDGVIPSEIGQCSNLTGLFTTSNERMTGALPSELGLLTDLKWLVLDRNMHTGQLPSELFQLSNVYWFMVQMNQFSGTIPSEIGQLSASLIHLFDNNLEGPIPSEIGTLKATEHLTLGGNPLLTGTLPSEIGDMEKLIIFGVWGTRLRGSVPPELSLASSLQMLILAENNLSGPIPSELGALSGLWALSLAGNSLTGTIPLDLCKTTRMTALKLSNNQLTGSLQTEIGRLIFLSLVDLSENELTGTLPSEIGQLRLLKELSLDSNQLSGTIPSDLGVLLKTESSLLLDFLTVGGELPDIVLSLVPSRSVNLGNNLLEGSLPSELGAMSSLKTLSVAHNSLTGAICSEIGQLESLEVLHLQDNELIGPLPSELGLLAAISAFNISGNVVSGVVPEQFCNLGSSAFQFDCSDKICGCDCAC